MRIALYNAASGHWWDKIIGFRTGSKYSHCEFLFSDGMCFSASPREGCARFKEIEFDAGKWDFLEVEGVTPEMEAMIRAWCRTIEGAKYDWPGIAGISIMKPINVPKWYFCSEALAAGLRWVGVLESLNPCMTSPGTLEVAVRAWNDCYQKVLCPASL